MKTATQKNGRDIWNGWNDWNPLEMNDILFRLGQAGNYQEILPQCDQQ